MREKGINSQNEKNTLNKSLRNKGKIATKRMTKNDKSNLKSDAENNKNDEEEDISTHDPDRKILTKFIREQKKEIDEFINVKKQANTKQPTTAAK